MKKIYWEEKKNTWRSFELKLIKSIKYEHMIWSDSLPCNITLTSIAISDIICIYSSICTVTGYLWRDSPMENWKDELDTMFHKKLANVPRIPVPHYSSDSEECMSPVGSVKRKCHFPSFSIAESSDEDQDSSDEQSEQVKLSTTNFHYLGWVGVGGFFWYFNLHWSVSYWP